MILLIRFMVLDQHNSRCCGRSNCTTKLYLSEKIEPQTISSRRTGPFTSILSSIKNKVLTPKVLKYLRFKPLA